MRLFSSLVTAGLLVAAPLASASTITFNFEQFAYGQSIGEYFNGGRDSNNRLGGPDYGLSFANEVVKYTPRGAYLSGRVQLTIDANAIRSALGSEKFYITFSGSKYDLDGSRVLVVYEDGFREVSTYLPGTGNPYCTPFAESCIPYYGSTGTARVAAWDGIAHPVFINFDTDRLDNIQFHSYTGALPQFQGTFSFGSAALDRDIPEPTSVALLAIGATALFRRRRRDKSTLASY